MAIEISFAKARSNKIENTRFYGKGNKTCIKENCNNFYVV